MARREHVRKTICAAIEVGRSGRPLAEVKANENERRKRRSPSGGSKGGGIGPLYARQKGEEAYFLTGKGAAAWDSTPPHEGKK